MLTGGGAYVLSLAPAFAGLPKFDGRITAMIAVAAGAALLIASVLQFRSAKTQFMPNAPVNNSLVTGGVFGLTRNPMYLGMVLFCLAATLWSGRVLVLLGPALMFAVANWVFIPFEEAKMRRQFGEAFDAYCTRVRRWI